MPMREQPNASERGFNARDPSGRRSTHVHGQRRARAAGGLHDGAAGQLQSRSWNDRPNDELGRDARNDRVCGDVFSRRHPAAQRKSVGHARIRAVQRHAEVWRVRRSRGHFRRWCVDERPRPEVGNHEHDDCAHSSDRQRASHTPPSILIHDHRDGDDHHQRTGDDAGRRIGERTLAVLGDVRRPEQRDEHRGRREDHERRDGAGNREHVARQRRCDDRKCHQQCDEDELLEHEHGDGLHDLPGSHTE